MPAVAGKKCTGSSKEASGAWRAVAERGYPRAMEFHYICPSHETMWYYGRDRKKLL